MSKSDYKELIAEMLEEFDDSDLKFMKQIYTLVWLHLEKKRKVVEV